MYYIGNLKVKISPEFTDSAGGSVDGFAFPDLRAGLRWNMGKSASMVVEWRYINMSPKYESSEYSIFSSETARMKIAGSIYTFGISTAF